MTAQEGAESGDEAASEAESSTTTVVYDRMTEAGFGALGREEPQVMAALLAAKQAKDPEGWTAFQSQVRAFAGLMLQQQPLACSQAKQLFEHPLTACACARHGVIAVPCRLVS